MDEPVAYESASPITDGGMLRCPGCGNTNLHQYEVAVFYRLEDADEVLRTTVVHGASPDWHGNHQLPQRRLMVDEMPNDGSGNPSSRRHGLVIRFWCEHCSSRPELVVAQHKGAEFCEWRHFYKCP